MPDVTLAVSGVEDTPLDYPIPGAAELLPKLISASFDGSAAAGPWVPAIQLRIEGATGGATFPLSQSLAAGASADVAWFPRGGVGGSIDTTDGTTDVNPTSELFIGSGLKLTNPAPGEALLSATIQPPPIDDYVFRFTNTPVTGVAFGDRSSPVIIGNPITLDGTTRIKVEFFSPGCETQDGPHNQAIGFELWDDFPGTPVDKGTIAYVTGNANGTTAQFEAAVYGCVILTPAAGTYQYGIYAWKNVAGGTCTVFANTFVDGSGNLAPAWFRVTAT